MSTGNVKISQLAYSDNYANYGEGSQLRIPLSQNTGTDDAPQWESKGIKGDTLIDYIDSKLGISIASSSQTALRDDVNALYTDKLYALDFWELAKPLGHNINWINSINITSLSNTVGYISKTGEIKPSANPDSEFSHNTDPIHLKKGCLYALEINNVNHLPGVNEIDIPSDISWVTKVSDVYHDRENTNLKAGEVAEVVYEPLPTHYLKTTDGGYGIPVYETKISSTRAAGTPQINKGILVFFASEDMDAILSLPTLYWDNTYNVSSDTLNLREINFGLFVEFADQFLSVQGDLMKVLVEAIVKNQKDIQALQANINSLGDVKANTIELEDYPVIQGSPMVIIKDREPSEASGNHGDDVPNKIGQIWVDTKGEQAYIAVGLGSIKCWRPII